MEKRLRAAGAHSKNDERVASLSALHCLSPPPQLTTEFHSFLARVIYVFMSSSLKSTANKPKQNKIKREINMYIRT
jgi:hypothetical protein